MLDNQPIDVDCCYCYCYVGHSSADERIRLRNVCMQIRRVHYPRCQHYFLAGQSHSSCSPVTLTLSFVSPFTNSWSKFYNCFIIIDPFTHYSYLDICISLWTLKIEGMLTVSPIVINLSISGIFSCFRNLCHFKTLVLWRCWLGGRKGIRPVKNWVVGCWYGYQSGARCRPA